MQDKNATITLEVSPQEKRTIDFIRDTGPHQVVASLHELYRKALYWGEIEHGTDQRGIMALCTSYELADTIYPLPRVEVKD